MKFSLETFLSILILLITISSISQLSTLPIGNTFIWWGVNICALIAFTTVKFSKYNSVNDRDIRLILCYLAWNIVAIIHGFFVADNYWEWKNLIGTGMALLLPLSIYVSTNREIVQKITGTWILYALPAFFLFLPTFSLGDAAGRYLVPISFLLLFFPLLTNKWKIIILFFATFVILGDLTARSNVIKFGVPFILSFLYYFRFILATKFLELGRLILMLTPILLFSLGVTGEFNVFKINQYLTGNYSTTRIVDGQIKIEDLTVDTRTFLYEEVLNSAFKYDYIWFGRSPARGNESRSFGMFALEELHTGKMERFANEVSILNIFTWTGLVGVILYFLIFYRASYLAVSRSNNFILRITGLCVAFRWSYAWVEDFSQFDLSYFFLWIMIGMCYSKSFREMTDKEITQWVRGIFDKKFRKRNISASLKFKKDSLATT